MPREGSSPPRAGSPPTRRSSRAEWAGPASAAPPALEIDPERAELRIGDRELRAGDLIAIDGSTGVVTADDVRLVPPQVGEAFAEVLAWADELRRLGVRANADTGEDAARARELGAEGIGLCRTEHMFFGADREELVREMFIAGELARRERESGDPAAGAARAGLRPTHWSGSASSSAATSSRSSAR